MTAARVAVLGEASRRFATESSNEATGVPGPTVVDLANLVTKSCQSFSALESFAFGGEKLLWHEDDLVDDLAQERGVQLLAKQRVSQGTDVVSTRSFTGIHCLFNDDEHLERAICWLA